MFICISGGMECYFFGEFCVRTKLIMPNLYFLFNFRFAVLVTEITNLFT